MGERIAAVDAYIAHARPFARPILAHLRAVVHRACPAVEERIKWGMPHFEYRGVLCYMAAFKAHAAFGFYRHAALAKAARLPVRFERSAMGSFGRLTSLDELPPRRVLAALVKLAMKLADDRAEHPERSKRKSRPAIRPPARFMAALRANEKALATWRSFPPGHRREYLEWITEAKTQPTRERRVATAIEWLAEGKPRNWKYARRR